MFRFFENLVDPYGPYDQTDTPSRKLIPFLWDYARPFKRIFLVIGGMSIVVASVEIWLIWYLGRLLDLLETSSPESFWTDHWLEMVSIAVFVLLLRPVMQAVDVMLLNNTVLPNFGTLIRYRAHRHVLRQSVEWFENDFAGRIANRIMQTPPAAGESVFQVFDAVAYSLAYLLGAFVLLSDADPLLMIPLAVWFALFLILARWTVRRVGPASKAASDARSMVTGRVVDAYTNIHSVKLFANGSHEMDYALDAIEHSRRTFQREMRIYTIMDVSLTALNGLLIVAVVGWAIWLWTAGLASLGLIAVASALVLRLNAMTGWIMWAISSLFQNLGVVAEGMETIAQPITLTDSKNARDMKTGPGRISLCGVSHHYGRETGGLDNINLTIEPGQKVALVGRSGAGKSTLVKLLLRFYDLETGRIEIDGQDIGRIRQESLRASIGMVEQDASLLHRSVRDNIRYARPDAPDEDVIEAARKAQAHDFILDLEDPEGRRGYDAEVGERGVKLSGGQRQRVALARVILKDAPILLLDEATSALDSEVEAAIQDTLAEMMEGKTVLAIAHRLSTIAHMDRILVMDDGRIVEDGTHAELLAAGGLYASFWGRQSGGFIGMEAAE